MKLAGDCPDGRSLKMHTDRKIRTFNSGSRLRVKGQRKRVAVRQDGLRQKERSGGRKQN